MFALITYNRNKQTNSAVRMMPFNSLHQMGNLGDGAYKSHEKEMELLGWSDDSLMGETERVSEFERRDRKVETRFVEPVMS
jgi:hypothetical protein